MALIYAILAALAERPETSVLSTEIVDAVLDHNDRYKLDVVHYHVDLCMEAGYIRKIGNTDVPHRLQLTWNGHEALDDQGS